MDSDKKIIEKYVEKKLNKNYLDFDACFSQCEVLEVKIKISGVFAQTIETGISKLNEPIPENMQLVRFDDFNSHLLSVLEVDSSVLRVKTEEAVDKVITKVLDRSWNKGFFDEIKIPKAYTVEQCAACRGSGGSKCSGCSGRGKLSCPECNGSLTMRCRSCSGGYKSCGGCHGAGYLSQVVDIRDHTGQYISSQTERHPCSVCGGNRTILCYSCNGSSQVRCSNCFDGQVDCKGCGGTGTEVCVLCGGVGRLNKLGFIKESLKTPNVDIVDVTDHSLFDAVNNLFGSESLISAVNEIDYLDKKINDDGSFEVNFQLRYELKSYLLNSHSQKDLSRKFKVRLVGTNRALIDDDGFIRSRIEESLLVPEAMLSSSNSPKNWVSFSFLNKLRPILSIGEAKAFMASSLKNEFKSHGLNVDSTLVDWPTYINKISFLIRKILLIKFLIYQLFFSVLWFGVAHYRLYESVIASEFVFFNDNPIFFISDLYAYPLEKSISIDGWILVFLIPVLIIFIEYLIITVGNLASFRFLIKSQGSYFAAAMLASAISVLVIGFALQNSARNSILYEGQFTWVFEKYADRKRTTSFVEFLEENPFECGPKLSTVPGGLIPLYLLPLNSETFYAVFKNTEKKYIVGMRLTPGFYEIEMGKTSKNTKIYSINLSQENYCMKVYL